MVLEGTGWKQMGVWRGEALGELIVVRSRLGGFFVVAGRTWALGELYKQRLR